MTHPHRTWLTSVSKPVLAELDCSWVGSVGRRVPCHAGGEQIPALLCSPACYSEPQLPRQSKGLEGAPPRAELSTENQSCESFWYFLPSSSQDAQSTPQMAAILVALTQDNLGQIENSMSVDSSLPHTPAQYSNTELRILLQPAPHPGLPLHKRYLIHLLDEPETWESFFSLLHPSRFPWATNTWRGPPAVQAPCHGPCLVELAVRWGAQRISNDHTDSIDQTEVLE